jgi:hypothetical protein
MKALANYEAVRRALTGGHPALLDTPEVGDELRRRLTWLTREEAFVLVRWYVESERPEAIATSLGRSIRHVYRVRASAIHRIVALGQQEEFTNADVAEFV